MILHADKSKRLCQRQDVLHVVEVGTPNLIATFPSVAAAILRSENHKAAGCQAVKHTDQQGSRIARRTTASIEDDGWINFALGLRRLVEIGCYAQAIARIA